MKFHFHSLLEPLLRIRPGQYAFKKSRLVLTFLTNFAELQKYFRLVLERKTGIEITELSRLDFLVKSLANNFALSDAEGKTSRVSARVGGVGEPPLLKKLTCLPCPRHQFASKMLIL